MAEQNFTLEDIKNFMKEQLDINWVNYTIVISNQKGTQRKATIDDFKINNIYGFLVEKNRQRITINILVNNENFIIYTSKGATAYTADWQKFRNIKIKTING